jgi:hypothetical protein
MVLLILGDDVRCLVACASGPYLSGQFAPRSSFLDPEFFVSVAAIHLSVRVSTKESWSTSGNHGHVYLQADFFWRQSELSTSKRVFRKRDVVLQKLIGGRNGGETQDFSNPTTFVTMSICSFCIDSLFFLTRAVRRHLSSQILMLSKILFSPFSCAIHFARRWKRSCPSPFGCRSTFRFSGKYRSGDSSKFFMWVPLKAAPWNGPGFWIRDCLHSRSVWKKMIGS